jgi:tetratricopeptide (TPR) repeat protein
MMTDTLFDQALTLHSSGQLDEALQLYQSIVEQDSSHAGAIHLLGVVLSQKGQFQLAAQFIQNAILLNGAVPEFYINFGNALIGAGDVLGAEQAYGRAVMLNAQIPEAWFGLGNVRTRMGLEPQAVEDYKRAISLRPDFVEALVNLGKVYITLSQLDAAVEVLVAAATLSPTDARPGFMLAQALEAAGHPDEAATLYASLINLAPCPVSILFDAGNRLSGLGHHAQAVNTYRCALQQAPAEMVLWNNLGNSLRALDQLSDAKQAYLQALTLSPQEVMVLSNLGTVLKDLGELDDAIRLLRLAVERGGGAKPLSNLGAALYLQGDVAAAIGCFEAALKASPGDQDATFHLGVAQLRSGLWQEGWKNYEARWESSNAHEVRRHQASLLWEGESLVGKTILIWSEQGLGDSLQFVRFADQLAALGGKVVVECQAALVSLIQAMPSVSHVASPGQPLPSYDVHAPMLSLPHLLGVTLTSLPQAAAYLQVPPDRVAVWQDWHRSAFSQSASLRSDHPTVGLVWSGESARSSVECRLIDRRRSVDLATLAPVLAVEGVQFVSLQLGPARAQLTHWQKILDPAGKIRDFADTAALIAQLDLVICVDTSVAHLAAALGKPTWMLSRFDGCWRWLRGRSDSPWYPALRIFAQSEAGEWSQPVQALAEALVLWSKKA